MADYDPLDESGEGQGEGEEEDEDFRHELSEDERDSVEADLEDLDAMRTVFEAQGAKGVVIARSEEHTSELQSLTNLVCRLLLEKKKSAGYSSVGSASNRHTACSAATAFGRRF